MKMLNLKLKEGSMRHDSAWERYVVLKDWAPYLLLTVEMDWEETSKIEEKVNK